MKIYEPVSVGLFVVSVLAASYLLGKRVGYEQGIETASETLVAEGLVQDLLQVQNLNNTPDTAMLTN